MALENVHVMEHDRATSRLELVSINPTRQFLKWNKEDTAKSRGMALYTWQNGQWYGTGGSLLDPSDIPEEFLAEIVANPVVVTSVGPIVAAACKFCGVKMNSSEMESHLIEHVHKTMRAAGTVNYTDKPLSAKNTHTASPRDKIEKE